MKEQRILNFESEEEEAHWWFDHREETSQWMEDALREGSTLKLADVLKNEPERELRLWSRIGSIRRTSHAHIGRKARTAL